MTEKILYEMCEERKKHLVEVINIGKLSVLTGYRQRMVLAEKINEIIKKINLDCEPSNN